MTQDIIDAVAQGEKICEHIHLPLQSGSNKILKAMNRHYTVEDYHRLVSLIRETIPGVSLTTDLIVGFPGETDRDYDSTIKMVQQVRFDSTFIFRYSVRPGTNAAERTDDVPEPVKIERLEHLHALQRSMTNDINQGLIGQTVEVLVEGESERGGGQLVGRTRTDKTVVLNGNITLMGSCIPVTIEGSKGWTLWGKYLESSSGF
jgi:tRNA-2-methylthio-N6-dimethylallyladenosine synthase